MHKNCNLVNWGSDLPQICSVFLLNVQVKNGRVVCIFCKQIVIISEWDAHECKGLSEYLRSSSIVSPTLSEVIDMDTEACSPHMSPCDTTSSSTSSDNEEFILPTINVTRYTAYYYNCD